MTALNGWPRYWVAVDPDTRCAVWNEFAGMVWNENANAAVPDYVQMFKSEAD